MKLRIKFFILLAGLLLSKNKANAQSYEGYVVFAEAIKKYAPDLVPNWWKCTEQLRWDYYWEMADGAIAINRGVRCYRGDNYVFSSIFDWTSGDCDTEVWYNGKRYRNLCLGNAGGQGESFVESHGGVVAFYRK